MKRQTRFVSRYPAKTIVAAIEEVADTMGLQSHSRNYKVIPVRIYFIIYLVIYYNWLISQAIRHKFLTNNKVGSTEKEDRGTTQIMVKKTRMDRMRNQHAKEVLTWITCERLWRSAYMI